MAAEWESIMKVDKCRLLVSALGLIAGIEASITAGAAETPVAVEATSAGTLEEVVVTAQKRSEKLQDVPLAVTALTGDELTDAGVTKFLDLGQVVPTLSIGNAVGFSFVYLRGVGSTAIGPGIELPISFYLDGVYYASTVSPTFYDFANIDRVEVLKGPQGTLFGRNATGGLIQIITRDPTQQFQAQGEVTYGNYQTLTGKFYLSGGISENLAADLSVNAGTQGTGWGQNLYTASDVFKNSHNVTVRSKWVYTPTAADKITVIGDYSEVNNSMNGQKIAPGTIANPSVDTGTQPPLSPWDIYGDVNPNFQNTNYGGSLKYEHQFQAVDLSSLTAYRDSNTWLYWDVDFTPVPHLTGALRDLERQVSEELTLSSKNSGKLNWQTGFYYFHADGSYDPAGVYSGDGLFGPFTYIAPYAEQITQSEAVFAQGSYEIMDATNLTLGARYTWEKRTISGDTEGYIGNSPAIPLGTTPEESTNFNKPTYRVALDHRFSPEVMAYVSYNTGFKSGGYNTQFASQPAYLPETVDAYEVGIKNDLLDRHLRLNFAGFDYEYKNIQVQKVGVANTGIINGAKARIYGIDGDFEAIFNSNFKITGSAAWLHARFLEFTDAPFGSPGGGVPTYPGDASGNTIPKSPNFSAYVTPDYRIPLSEGSSLYLDATVEYNSGMYFEADNILKQSAYTRFNASIRWQSKDDRYYARLWGTNLGNESVINYSSTLGDGTRDITYDAPRQYGITVGAKF
jgi:iron complex outermembrane recepter protein